MQNVASMFALPLVPDCDRGVTVHNVTWTHTLRWLAADAQADIIAFWDCESTPNNYVLPRTPIQCHEVPVPINK